MVRDKRGSLDDEIESNWEFIQFAAQYIENQLDQLHMLGLDDSDRETIPDYEIFPQMMSDLSDQMMMVSAG